jgi:hypothetical protein
MTYIYEMASGTEYLGEELSCPKRAAAMTTPVLHPARDESRVELRLALVDALPSRSALSDFPVGLDLDDLFNAIED